MNPKSLAPMLVSILGLGSSIASAQSLTTAFTYQGKLQNGGSPASGLHDFRFRLYDAASLGSPVGGIVCLNNVAVSQGLFTASLDFGAVFAGQQRFLEIEVRADTGLDCASSSGFVPLSPRQILAATPNALFALSATQFNGQPPAFYQNAANLTSGALNVARLPSPLVLSGSSGTNILRAVNSSTTPGSSGVVGISTAASGGTAGVAGESQSTQGIGVYGYSGSETGMTYGVIGENYSSQGNGVAGLAVADSGITNGVYGESYSPNGRGVVGQATATSGATFGVFGQSASNEGRGLYGLVNATTPAVNGVNAVLGEATATSGLATGGRFSSDSTSGRGVVGSANAATGFTYGVQGFAGSSDGRAIFGYATSPTGATFAGNFIDNSNAGTGVYGEANSPSGITYGGRFVNSSTTGYGVYAQATATSGSAYGVLARTDSTAGIGVLSIATGLSGSTYAVLARNDSTAGTSVFGNATATSGGTIGVHGNSDSPGGIGVKGVAGSAANTAISTGVYGEAANTFGRGVFGKATASTGVVYGGRFESQSISGRGVYGETNQSTGSSYGVIGVAPAPGGGARFAVFASGDMGAAGTKPFRIDHPDDPSNKYLLHYASESPEVINFYRGTVTLNGAGEAIVELPHYFAKVNKQPSYQLTAVGAGMPMLHVAEKISELSLGIGARAEPQDASPVCWFRIAGGAPGGEVSWRVEAVRNDRLLRTHVPPVEIDKLGPEKGTYQMPELYGQPAELGMNYDGPRLSSLPESSSSTPD